MVDKEQFETLQTGLLVRAPAKINLSLLIAGKRPDGFHEIETVMAKINWYDELLIEDGEKKGIELICRGDEWAPAGDENLVYKASQLLHQRCGLEPQIKLTLTKNIPAGSGLGSASSDAAASLSGLNRFLNLDLPAESLSQMAAERGSDISFFLGDPLALCTGKGEKVQI
ncbi:MAG: 4-(cytidine 5'-diphospho)-2-C-methyl-D-erythritol kinase, partial [Planctomycetota bacterium]